MTPDLIQFLFNIGGAIAISTSIPKLLKDKYVAGIHWPMMMFFITWSAYNLYFYSYLNQWYAFIGGVAMLLAEFTYLTLLLIYTYPPKVKDSYSSYLEEMSKNGNKNHDWDPHISGKCDENILFLAENMDKKNNEISRKNV